MVEPSANNYRTISESAVRASGTARMELAGEARLARLLAMPAEEKILPATGRNCPPPPNLQQNQDKFYTAERAAFPGHRPIGIQWNRAH